MEVHDKPVVVGLDGSSSARAAFAHAAWEAHRRGVPLRLVHAHSDPVYVPPGAYVMDSVAERYALASGRAVLAELELKAHMAYPHLTVTASMVPGSAAGALVEESHDATLVVVGSRGLGGFEGLLLGSVGTQLAAHSRAPVIVIRPAGEPGHLGVGPPHLPVVVGVDGVPESEAALAFAFDEASARGVPLVALYAWWMLPVANLGPTNRWHYDLLEAEEEAHRLLSEAAAGWRAKYPEVEMQLVAAHSLNPTVALLEAGRNAGLLVVSRHGGNTLTRLLAGSVGDSVVRQAACPVAVVPESPI
jgi:nucleotide-binding universal stress UspA family protein